ncbi:MAG TPA: SLATT domain-containing protein [Anaerolineaceae bacterium]|nr:SLATT domain-containing protein [Anaerolineaceae bacterium]
MPGILQTLNIQFSDDQQAQAVVVPLDAEIPQVMDLLGLSPDRKVILLAGSASELGEKLKDRVSDLFDAGLANILDPNTVIVDGATVGGIIDPIGQSPAVQEKKPVLLGVAPLGKVCLPDCTIDGDGRHALEPNHTHFVLVESGSWQGATRMFVDLSQALAARSPDQRGENCELPYTAPRPRLVMLLIGGSPTQVSLDEAQACVERGWPLIVIEDSGRLADQISAVFRAGERIERLPRWSRPILRRLWLENNSAGKRLQEIVRDGNIEIFSASGTPKDFQRLLKTHFQEPETENILNQAWQRYILYSQNAKHNQKMFYRFRNLALILTWMTTLVVLLQPLIAAPLRAFLAAPAAAWKGLADLLGPLLGPLVAVPGASEKSILDQAVHGLAILLPILTSILLSAEERMKAGNKWLALRASAESILGGIYSYRMLSCYDPLSSIRGKRPARASELADHLRKITSILIQIQISDLTLHHAGKETTPPRRFKAMGDDGFSAIGGEEYVRYRLQEQLGYFRARNRQLTRSLQVYRWGIWLAGGLGTLLAAFGNEYWLPLTAGAVTAFSAYLEYRQVDQVLMANNQAEAALSNVLAWWSSLDSRQRQKPANVARVLDETETVLESNVSVWVRQMQAAQEKVLQGQEEPKG